MIYSKLVYGYAVQSYDSETGACVQQQFVADGRVERVDDAGQAFADETVTELANTEKECPLDMVQP